MNKIIFGTLFFAFSLISAISFADPAGLGDPRDPVGENTLFRIDTNRTRTSSMILKGESTDLVTRYIAGNPNGGVYEIKDHCSMDIQFSGHHEATTFEQLNEYFFNPQFIADLRAGNIYTDPNMKLKHLGYKDALNLDGRRYIHCDELLMYDIKTENASFPGASCLKQAIQQAARAEAIRLGQSFDPNAGIENMRVRLLLQDGIPILGIVKLDASGTYNGMDLKLGADYIAQ